MERSTCERQRGVYLEQTIFMLGVIKATNIGHQGELQGISNTNPRWRQDGTLLTIHCPSPGPPGFHLALQGLYALAEGTVSIAYAFIPPLDVSSCPNRFRLETGSNCKLADNWLLEENVGFKSLFWF